MEETKGLSVGDNITVSYQGEEKGFGISYKGSISFQAAVSMANAVLYNVIEMFTMKLAETIEDEKELDSMKTIMYDDLNDRFSALLEPVMPQAAREQLEDDISLEMANEELMLDLKFKAFVYDKLVATAKEKGHGYVKATLKENGEIDI